MKNKRRRVIIGGITLFIIFSEYLFRKNVCPQRNSNNYSDLRAEGSIGTSTDSTPIQVLTSGVMKAPGVLLRVKGGLGNQLFQYACSYAIARKYNWPLYLILPDSFISSPNPNKNITRGFQKILSRWVVNSFQTEKGFSVQRQFALHHFSIPLGLRNGNVSNKTTIESPLIDITDPEILSLSEPEDISNHIVKLSPKDYCQSEMFFSSYKQEILKQFTPNKDIVIDIQSSNWAKLIRNTESVFVHVRLGDFVIHKDAKSMSYYQNAMERMVKLLKYRGKPSPEFFIFSDDIQFVKTNLEVSISLKNVVHYVSLLNSKDNHLQDIKDFVLMTHCKHGIISQSSYGWWAAYLIDNPDKLIIAAKFNTKKIYNLHFKWQYSYLYYPISWFQL